MKIFAFTPGHFLRLALQMAMIVASLATICMVTIADERPLRVARISLIEGEVNYQRANDSRKDWFDATLNLPLDESDQLYSGPSGRAEIQLSGRNLIRISRDTNLRFTQFSSGVIQLALPIGTATFRIHSLDRRQLEIIDANDNNADEPVYFEVDTPTAAITFVKEGDYRINVLEDGSTEVIVRNGQAEVYNKEIGTIDIKKGRRAIIEEPDYYKIAKLEDKDDWDRWNDRRDDDLFSRVDTYRSSRYVPAALPGVYDLDYYGEWLETPDYGWVWSPRNVALGWAPYRAGYWRWHPSYGWTWISYEPWGWVPYHYGRWTYYRSRWCWTPYVNLALGYGWGWRPHLVTFYGWGGSYNRGYRDGYRDGYHDGNWDYVGWCPLGPRDRHHDNHDIRDTRDTNGRVVNVQSLDNYNAPGGRNMIERRRFDNGRAVVTEEILKAPAPQRTGVKNQPEVAVLVRHDEIKPTQQAPSRNPLANRIDFARKIESPVIARRPIERSPGATAPIPTREGKALPPAPERGGLGAREKTETGPVPTNRSVPGRTTTGVDAQASPRESTGQVERPQRSPRAPEYRPVERAAPPVFRNEPSRPPDNTESAPPTRRDAPSRDSMPSRPQRNSDEEHRRPEPPPRPRVERHDPPPQPREQPRPEPSRESAPSRGADRPSSPPPSRESAPSRGADRPSSPPPSRESAPSRGADRPSSPPPSRESAPPARESAPARSPERPSSPPPSERPSSPPPSRESAPSRPSSPERQAPSRPVQ